MKFRSRDSARSAARSGRGILNRVRAAALSFAVAIAGCGGGGGSAPAALDRAAPAEGASSFTITSDSYGVQNPTYLAATRGAAGLILRAAIASAMTDPQFKTVARVDIGNPDAVAAGTVYSLGGAENTRPAFPGTLYLFNGHPSTLLQTTGGTIAFTSYGTAPGDQVSGSFHALILDGNDDATPKRSYTVAASFSFKSGDCGPILPPPVPVPPEAPYLYSSRCAACHTLGNVNAGAGTAPELALKGGELDSRFSIGSPGHQGVTLGAKELSALKVLLNAN